MKNKELKNRELKRKKVAIEEINILKNEVLRDKIYEFKKKYNKKPNHGTHILNDFLEFLPNNLKNSLKHQQDSIIKNLIKCYARKSDNTLQDIAGSITNIGFKISQSTIKRTYINYVYCGDIKKYNKRFLIRERNDIITINEKKDSILNIPLIYMPTICNRIYKLLNKEKYNFDISNKILEDIKKETSSDNWLKNFPKKNFNELIKKSRDLKYSRALLGYFKDLVKTIGKLKESSKKYKTLNEKLNIQNLINELIEDNIKIAPNKFRLKKYLKIIINSLRDNKSFNLEYRKKQLL